MPLINLRGNWILRNGLHALITHSHENYWFGHVEIAEKLVPSFWSLEGMGTDREFDVITKDRKRDLVTGGSG